MRIITETKVTDSIQGHRSYKSPTVRELPLGLSPYCTSPYPGGNEDIGYEDWN